MLFMVLQFRKGSSNAAPKAFGGVCYMDIFAKLLLAVNSERQAAPAAEAGT
jgi:hypothetical protein